MNLLRFCTAALMSLSLVGCCCSRCLVTDPCDPCGSIPKQGCSLTRWWNSHHGQGWGAPCGCTCGACGCGDSMDGLIYGDTGCAGSCAAPSSCAAPMMTGVPSSSGCNCGQSAQYSAFPAMSSPTYLNSSPTVVPQPIPEIPPSQAPAPPATNTLEPQTMMSPGNGQPQMVSYEEFQRLPGNVVSAPGSTGTISIPAPIQQVSTTTQSFVAPPAPAPAVSKPAPKFINPGPNNRQAVWTPSRGN